MTILDEALEIATVLEDGKWKLGDKLLEGLEAGEFTIREFALLRDKSTDRDDSYSNYARASKFKYLCSEMPGFDKLLKLPMSYHYEAMKAIDAGQDIEDILDWMYQSAYDAMATNSSATRASGGSNPGRKRRRRGWRKSSKAWCTSWNFTSR